MGNRFAPGKRQITLVMLDKLIDLIDDAATTEGMTRTGWIVEACEHHLPRDLCLLWEAEIERQRRESLQRRRHQPVE